MRHFPGHGFRGGATALVALVRWGLGWGLGVGLSSGPLAVLPNCRQYCNGSAPDSPTRSLTRIGERQTAALARVPRHAIIARARTSATAVLAPRPCLTQSRAHTEAAPRRPGVWSASRCILPAASAISSGRAERPRAARARAARVALCASARAPTRRESALERAADPARRIREADSPCVFRVAMSRAGPGCIRNHMSRPCSRSAERAARSARSRADRRRLWRLGASGRPSCRRRCRMSCLGRAVSQTVAFGFTLERLMNRSRAGRPTCRTTVSGFDLAVDVERNRRVRSESRRLEEEHMIVR